MQCHNLTTNNNIKLEDKENTMTANLILPGCLSTITSMTQFVNSIKADRFTEDSDILMRVCLVAVKSMSAILNCLILELIVERMREMVICCASQRSV